MLNQSLILVDGSYCLFRAFHAMPAFTNSAGEPTGAIFGVVNMLRKILDDYKPDYFAVVFDAKGKSFRNDWYPEYKANRPPIPEELSSQIQPLHDIIRAEGLPLLIIDGVEADDVIATLAVHADRRGIKTIIATGDKDLAQIVNGNINLLNSKTDKLLDPSGVREKFGVSPEHIVDYLALVGDSVDNIPGVPKVGPKTAAKWLQKYGSLDEVVDHADEIGGKVGECLRASLATLPLSRKLVSLKLDLKLNLDVSDLYRTDPDLDSLSDYFKRWEFKSLLNQLPVESSNDDSQQDKNNDKNKIYKTIFTDDALTHWIETLEASRLFAFDTETTSLNYTQAEIVGLSFAVEPGKAAYVPLTHDYAGVPTQLSREHVLSKLQPILSSPNIYKLGHNIKYDKHVLANHDIDLNGICHDTMLQSYILDSTASRHDMDTLASNYLNYTTIHFEDVAGKGSKQLTFNAVPIETAAVYAAEDADITLQLHNKLWPKLLAIPTLKKLYQEVEMPLLNILTQMECNGVLINAEMLKLQSAELSENISAIEISTYKLAGQEFNINSPKQIQTILYDKMNLPVISKTPKGQPSTAESILQELAIDYELPKLILAHRSLSKLKSTYTQKLPDLINLETGRVHTSYHQAVAATGRLSSSAPNLQNIPIRSAEGKKIRRAFVAPAGCLLLAADYSQIELRIMAHLSEDTALRDAFANNLDIHRLTAAEVFNSKPNIVTDEQRRAAKAINFGLIYGMSPFGLSRQLRIDFGQAKQYVECYFEKYPSVKKYMDTIRQSAREKGYVETVFNRRLYLPEINSRNATQRQYAERTAINAPMQGTAADIIKRAMIEIEQKILQQSKSIKMIMQVHDELVFEVEQGAVDEATSQIRTIMVNVPELSVPLLVDIGIGSNWDEAH